MCAAAGQQSAQQHGESCHFINSLNVQKHHISYFERRDSPPMPLRPSLLDWMLCFGAMGEACYLQ